MSTKVQRMLKRLKKQTKVPRSGLEKANYIKKQAKRMSKKTTWPEREFAKMLKQLKISFEVQKIVGGKIYDFFIPSKNMLVEVDGDYYHGKDLVYEEKNSMQRYIQKNDKVKDIMAVTFAGYKIERIWEGDLKENYESEKERFKKLLK